MPETDPPGGVCAEPEAGRCESWKAGFICPDDLCRNAAEEGGRDA